MLLAATLSQVQWGPQGISMSGCRGQLNTARPSWWSASALMHSMRPPELLEGSNASTCTQCRQSRKPALQCDGMSARRTSTLLLQLCPCTTIPPCGAGGVDVSAVH